MSRFLPREHRRRVDREQERAAGPEDDRDLRDEEDLIVGRRGPENVLVDVPREHGADGEHKPVGRGHHRCEDDHRKERPERHVRHGVLDADDEGVVLRVHGAREHERPLLDERPDGKPGELHEEHHDRVDRKRDERRPPEVAGLLCSEDVVDDVRRAGEPDHQENPKRDEELRRRVGV